MKKKQTPTLNATVNTAEAAECLAKELGGKPSHWAIWLANDRKPTRVNRHLPQEPGPGRPRYRAMAIEAFVDTYRRDHPQPGRTGIQPEASKGRRFTPHIAALTLAEGADQAGVLFVIAKPLASFILSSEDARHIAVRLIKAADEIDLESQQ